MDNATGATRWYVYDGLGTVVGEVAAYVGQDEQGGNVAKMKLNPTSSNLATASEQPLRKLAVYGGSRNTVTGAGNHRFVGSLGHTTSDETGGLVYMQARYYDPGIGRFVSEDPAKDGISWYAYSGCNPVNCADPNGRIAFSATDLLAIGCVVGAAIAMAFSALPIAVGFVIAGAIITLIGAISGINQTSSQFKKNISPMYQQWQNQYQQMYPGSNYFNPPGSGQGQSQGILDQAMTNVVVNQMYTAVALAMINEE